MEGDTLTSEAFTSAMQRISLEPYIDEIQAEIARALKEGGLKKDEELQAELVKLDGIVRTQSKKLAQELKLSGDPLLLHMLTAGMLSVAWTAFEIRRASMDDKRPFDVRLDLVEMSNGLANALSLIVSRSATYAEIYKKKPDSP